MSARGALNHDRTPGKTEASDHSARVIAAARATARWIEARRSTWVVPPREFPAAVAPALQDRAPANGLPAAVVEPASPPAIVPAVEKATAPPARTQPALADKSAGWWAWFVERIPRWLPFGLAAIIVAALVAVLGLAGTRFYKSRPITPATGVAVLESTPPGSQVWVDGQALGATPLTTTLAAGPHDIEFRFRKSTRTMRVNVDRGDHIVKRIDWTLKATGRLHVQSDPPGAKVLIDGVARGETPLRLDDVTVGTHAVVIERAGGSIRRSVTVGAGETTKVSEALVPGWITVFAPFELTVSEGSHAVHLDDRHQAILPPGSHELRLENRALGFEDTRKVEVRPGASLPLSIVPPRSTLTVTSTTPAEVWLDGTLVGGTPLVNLPVDLGTREVLVKSADGRERRLTTVVTVKPTTLAVAF